jgi:hypothetical protein
VQLWQLILCISICASCEQGFNEQKHQEVSSYVHKPWIVQCLYHNHKIIARSGFILLQVENCFPRGEKKSLSFQKCDFYKFVGQCDIFIFQYIYILCNYVMNANFHKTQFKIDKKKCTHFETLRRHIVGSLKLLLTYDCLIHINVEICSIDT